LLTDGESSYQENGVFFMDSTAFDVFSWRVVKGDPKTALTAPYSMVLTESTAKRYFGNEDPTGKTLEGSDSPGRSNAGDYTVTAVIEDSPANLHFKFNMLLSLRTFIIKARHHPSRSDDKQPKTSPSLQGGVVLLGRLSGSQRSSGRLSFRNAGPS
jgi:hypothetical protein